MSHVRSLPENAALVEVDGPMPLERTRLLAPVRGHTVRLSTTRMTPHSSDPPSPARGSGAEQADGAGSSDVGVPGLGTDGRRVARRRTDRALLAGLAVLAVGAALLATRDWRPPARPSGALDPRIAAGAWGLCKRIVTERLSAMPTVQLPWLDERAIERVGDSVFVVRAAVDARSATGEPLRVPFVCRARWLGADRWLDESTVLQTP
jgi:hypothetical protein